MENSLPERYEKEPFFACRKAVKINGYLVQHLRK